MKHSIAIVALSFWACTAAWAGSTEMQSPLGYEDIVLGDIFGLPPESGQGNPEWTVGPGGAKPLPYFPPARPAFPVHRVTRGDTLWGLAEKYCSSGFDWKQIYEANRDKIQNPHWIYPGQEFVVTCGNQGAPPFPFTPDPNQTPPTPPGSGAGPQDTGSIPGGNGPHRIRQPALNFARYLPLDPGTYSVGQTIGASRDGGRRRHEGIDLIARGGTVIRTIGDGVVTRAKWGNGYGWHVYVRHPNGFETRYTHMQNASHLRPGDRVLGGQPVGSVGATGNANGTDHLHFEIRNASRIVLDPHEVFIF